ncbi:MAG: DUF5330 domain-containing protein [Rhizobiales bacterium]|nr:DUF5330 domain-containing protein [Hyphomicrobiales bacterium]
MFLLRCIFWLSVVVMFLPVAPGDKNKLPNISAFEAFGAAATAVKDMSGFCERNPDTCDTGGKAAVALGYKAKYQMQQLLKRVNADDDVAVIEAVDTVKVVKAETPAIKSLTNELLSNPQLVAKLASELTPEMATAAINALIKLHPLPVPAPKS